MGSKRKLLAEIAAVTEGYPGLPAVDLFSGSGYVSYLLKAQGRPTTSIDYMAMSATFAKALVENNSVLLDADDVSGLLGWDGPNDAFVANTFEGLYFSDEDNELIDRLRSGISAIADPHKRALAMSALIRACMKKRPRGIFTYTGMRYDDGRRDLLTPLSEHFSNAVDLYNNAVFNNGQSNFAKQSDALDMPAIRDSLVYIDPPYYSPLSDNEYVRRYHFVEGLARNWAGVEMQEHTKTKKFKSYPTPFSTRQGTVEAFATIFERNRDNVMVVSYSSNSLPTLDEMVALLEGVGKSVKVVPVAHRYSAGNHGHRVGDNKNAVTEYLFVAS